MKKITLLFTIAFMAMSFAGFAKKIIIKVQNFQFTPGTVNAKLGDTIIFKWVNGSHTTTSTSVPAGASTWDKPINSTSTRFKYVLKKTGTYKYKCTPHAGMGMLGTINVTAALIADLNSFAITDDNAKAILNWKTTSSADVSYFSIQRSTDGNNFTEIAKVNPNSANLYSFKDDNAVSSKYIYYQVEMKDVNGNRQLSPIQMFINNNAGIVKLITSLSPNPISSPGHLMVQFNADKDGTMLARLYNQSGTMIKEQQFSTVQGLNNGHFHMGNLMPGTYYIVFTLGNIVEKHSIIMK